MLFLITKLVRVGLNSFLPLVPAPEEDAKRIIKVVVDGATKQNQRDR